MLCVVGSLLTIEIAWPVITPSTCGLYLHPLWFNVTGSFGASNVRFPRPSFTYTNTLAKFPPLTTTVSAVFVPEQFGSWLISIFAARGAAPSNFTVPLTPAAVAGSIGAAAGAAGLAGCSSAVSFLPQPASRATSSLVWSLSYPWKDAGVGPENTQWLFSRLNSPEGIDVPGLIACGSIIQRSTQSGFSRPRACKKLGAVAVRSWPGSPVA